MKRCKPDLNLVIPMAGVGSRFRNAGYNTYKPFIKIDNRSMVQRVVENFPSHVKTWIITCENLLTDEEASYLKDRLGCTLIFIEGHKEGPAYSILMAEDNLPRVGGFFISYCDIDWTWEFSEVEHLLVESNIVFTHRGFHPHLINDSFSAFCKTRKSDDNLLDEIREKSSFTDSWMEEPVSIGLFYVVSWEKLFTSLANLIGNNNRVAGEFFPSLIFNELAESGNNVTLHDVSFYIHWGVPAQLEDFIRWREITADTGRRESGANRQSSYPEFVLYMTGSGEPISECSPVPKPLIPVEQQPMYEFISNFFPFSSRSIVTTEDISNLIENHNHLSIDLLDEPICSQFNTLEKVAGRVFQKEKFFLASCDCFGIFDFKKFLDFVNKKEPDVVIFTFRLSKTQRKLWSDCTYVSCNDDRVSNIHIKAKASEDNLCLAGFFWINNGNILRKIVDVPVVEENEMCADHLFKYLIELGANIFNYELSQYVHLGTHEERDELQFWLDHRSVFSKKLRDE